MDMILAIVSDNGVDNHTLVQFTNGSYACSCGATSSNVPSLRRIIGTTRGVIFDEIAAGAEMTTEEPVCMGCGKNPDQIPEYNSEFTGIDLSNRMYVVSHEGTYNPLNGHFLCTDCYINAGMPTNPWGWVAD